MNSKRPKRTKPPFAENRLDPQILAEARIPLKFWNLLPATFSGTSASLEMASQFLERALAHPSEIGVLFEGGPRSGKTFLACWLLRGFLSSFPGMYTTHAALADIYMGKGSMSFDSFRRYTVVVVDNVEEGNLPCVKGLHRLLRDRLDNGQLTILVTELDSESRAAKLGQAEDLIRDYFITIPCVIQPQALARLLSARRSNYLITEVQ